MKAAEVEIGAEYAYKRSYGAVRRVKVIEKDVEGPRRRPYLEATRGTLIEVLDDPPRSSSSLKKGEQIVVQNRYLRSPWTAHVREEAADDAAHAMRKAIARSDEQAEEKLAAIWNDLMRVIGEGVESDLHYDGGVYRRSLKLDPRDALELAQRLAMGAPPAAFFARRGQEIKKVIARQDEEIEAARAEYEQAIAGLTTKEEQ